MAGMDFFDTKAPNKAMKASMKKRIGFGGALIVLIVAVLLVDWYLESRHILAVRALPLVVVLVPLLAVAFVELSDLTARGGAGVLTISGSFGALLLAGMPFWWQRLGRPADAYAVLAVLGAVQLPIFLEQMIRFHTADATRRVGMTLLAVVYLGTGLAIMLAIRMKWGVAALVLLLAVVKCSDIGAYFVGSAIGRHKLIPWLSPGKSWEGLGGALAAGVVVSIFVVTVLGLGMGVGRAAVFGAALAAAGQFGDLCESLLKRSAGIKDSGALVPEFGGTLDILDSLLLAAPVAYLILV
jgi:phosphatidate cytidylyltransferase